MSFQNDVYDHNDFTFTSVSDKFLIIDPALLVFRCLGRAKLWHIIFVLSEVNDKMAARSLEANLFRRSQGNLGPLHFRPQKPFIGHPSCQHMV
jgi:hypothetical protein